MNLIDVKNLLFKYKMYSGEKEEVIEHTAIDNISLSIKKGDFVGILGHNGSGKSTLAKQLAALLKPSGGIIYVGGMDTAKEEQILDIRKTAGLVFQNPDNQFIGATVRDDIAFGLENTCVPQSDMDKIINTYAAKVGMSDFLDHEPTKLSGGQKQRVAIAGILAMAPTIIILDEATSMLDPMGRREINSLVKELNKEKDITIISITHDIEEAKNADQVIMLSAGEVVASGNPKDILSDEANLVKYELDIPFALKVAKGLEKLNIRTSMSLQEEVLITELCQLHLKK